MIRIERPTPITFFHLPKTGGMAVSYWLIENTGAKWFPGSNVHGAKHADEVKAINWLKKYPHKFSKNGLGDRVMIVRNPWDRCVSAWKYWNRKGLVNNTFEEWVHGDWKLAEKQALQYFKPATRDTVVFLRYENLDKELDWFRNRIDIDWTPLEIHNAAPDNDMHWRDYYTPELRDKVYKRHNKDITYFGYTFD